MRRQYMPEVTVVIPVGPEQHHCRWLLEAVASVRRQSVQAAILLIDDMHGLDAVRYDQGHGDAVGSIDSGPYADCYIWDAPWHLGVAHAFNMGVSLMQTEWAIMLGADDVLEPDCVEQALEHVCQDPKEIQRITYYSLPLRYMDTGEEQIAACNAAMVSKYLWRETGGFPVESASGAPDAALLSMIWNSLYFRIRSVGERPLYNYRRHGMTDTASRGPWQGVILETRNLLTQQFKKPTWGRYS